jgi:hypothetical protein
MLEMIRGMPSLGTNSDNWPPNQKWVRIRPALSVAD